MLFAPLATIIASLAVANAVPLDKRAGPSGSVVSPSGGTNIASTEGYPTGVIHFEYKPVYQSKDSGCGGYGCTAQTWYVSVALQDGSGKSTPLAEALTGATVQDNIEAYLKVPKNFCGDYKLVVTEYQNLYGKSISFKAAAPAIHVECDPVP